MQLELGASKVGIYSMARPRSTDHFPQGAWIDVEDAFRAFDLQPKLEDDRKAWLYFIASSVRAAYQTSTGWVEIDGPYHVAFQNGQYSIVPVRSGVVVPPGAKIAFSGEDLRHILQHVPFLFDSMGSVALDVGTRQIVWRKWPEPLLEASPGMDFSSIRQAVMRRKADERAVWRKSIQGKQSIKDAKLVKRMARLDHKIRATSDNDPSKVELRREWKRDERRFQEAKTHMRSLGRARVLDEHTHLDGLTKEAVDAAWEHVSRNPELFEIFGEPWSLQTNHQVAPLKIAPPFAVRDPGLLPAFARAPAWLDHTIQELKQLESLARCESVAELLDETERRQQESVDYLHRRLRVSEAHALHSDVPNLFISEVLNGIRARREAFLRADKRPLGDKRRELVGAAVPNRGSCIVCGAKVYQRDHGGHPPTYCPSCDTKVAGKLGEAYRKRVTRDAKYRRDLT